jgi:hypothetical protein
MRATNFGLFAVYAMAMAIVGFAQAPDMLVDASVLANARNLVFHPTPHDLTNGLAHSRFGIFGIDSIPNFNDQFFADGFDPNGNPNRHWYTNTAGNPPQMGGTTVINAPLQPVNVELDDASGQPRFINGHPLISLVTPFITPVLNSPVFSKATYSSSDTPTQFSDAVQRAQYFKRMKPDWHTLLAVDPKPPLTLHINQSAVCPNGPNFAGCNYVFSVNGDGTCCAFILVNGLTVDAIDAVLTTDILGNVITTRDISTVLFPNTFVYFGDITNCCILGFHSYLFEPGTDPEKRWVFNFSSWISPNPIGQFFVAADIAGLSHEMTEIYNDPFIFSDGVHDVTPWWLAPNGNCMTVLETGDVLERLPNSLFPITLNGFTYHPQNETLLQWFEFMSPSDALGGAYSYPDTSLLTHLSAPQKAFCRP